MQLIFFPLNLLVDSSCYLLLVDSGTSQPEGLFQGSLALEGDLTGILCFFVCVICPFRIE